MFEPIGGSAPKYTGADAINPLACILAGSLMLETLGETLGAKSIEQSVVHVITHHLKRLEAGRMGHTTTQVGDLTAKYLV